MSVIGYTPSYSTSSPYNLTPVVGPFMYYYIHRAIDPHEDDARATMDNINYVHRPDLLANDLYADPDLWWVFGVRNGWEDPVYDLTLNRSLIIPPVNYLREVL